jgi:Flp pilus assembly protein TadD
MKKKVVFVTLVLAFFSLAAYAQERTQRLFTNGVNVSLINNGDRLHFNNENTRGESSPSSGAITIDIPNLGDSFGFAGSTARVSGWTTVDLIVYFADGTNQVMSINVPVSIGRQRYDTSGMYRGEQPRRIEGGFTSTSESNLNLSKRAAAISLPTAAQANAARNQREAAAREQAAERERAAAAERAQREAAERAERAERERREAAERVQREEAERAAAAVAAERAAVPTYMENGTAAFSRNDWDRAIAEFTRVISIEPRYAMAYNNRGAAYNGKREWDRAIADFTEAIRIDPNYAAPCRHRAYAYMQKGNFTQARAEVNRALQINPNYQNARDLSAELQRRGY